MHIGWPPEIREKLHELVADSPLSYRKYLKEVEASIEFQAQKLGKSEIDEEALVRGYITIVPRHLRDGIIEVITQHNYDMMYFRPIFDEPQFLPSHHPRPAV